MTTCESLNETLVSTSEGQDLRQRMTKDKDDIVRRAKDTIRAASRLIRRKVPQAGHFMTSRKFWMQTVSDQDVDVAITFPPETGEADVLWFKSKLERVPGLIVQTKSITLSIKNKTHDHCFALHLSATYQGYLRGLEQLQVPKPLRDDLGGGVKEFTINEGPSFKNIEDLSLFLTSQERQCIILHLVSGIKAEKGDAVAKASFREGEAIVPRSVSSGVIHQLFPLHQQSLLDKLKKSWVQKVLSKQPLSDITEYFGIKIGFYFAWLGHYTASLCIPAVVGILVWYCLCGRAEFLEDLAFVLFAFFNVIWATLYLESWKRKSAELAYQWGTADQRDELLTDPRPLFTGEERISEITGKPELFYPEWKRHMFRYFVSVPVITFCLLVVFVTVFLILELQQWWDVFLVEHGLFSFLKAAPKILLGIVIPILDGFYNDIAIWLNDKENYRTDGWYENHLIIKKASFQFVNSFLALFYTAFYLQDMDKLKELLAALLITRQVVGNVKESLIPYAKKYFKMAKFSFDKFGEVDSKKNDDLSPSSETSGSTGGRKVSQVEVESSFVQYEGTFDDYLEMFIQFGYVTLFSCAYPLAGFWALLNNIIEIRGDAFKLCFVHQRPFGQRVRNIGTWQTAMEMMGVIGCLVNCALIGLSGEVDRIFPNITSSQTILLIVFLEHLMLFLKVAIAYAIPDTPQWVATEMAKIEYKRREIEKATAFVPPFSAGASESSSVEMADKEGQCEPGRGAKIEFSSSSEDNTDHCRDSETEAFRAAVTNSSSDVFFKSTGAGGGGVMAKAMTTSVTTRTSPLRSNSLILPEDTESTSEAARKRSCPAVATIPEDQSLTPDEARAKVETMAASIVHHDSKHGHVPIITLDDTEVNGPRKKKLLSKRMASDTDLWLSIKDNQSRYARMVSVATAASSRTASASVSAGEKDKIFINRGVEMPSTHPASSLKAGSGAPTPVGKRVLDQEEFNKKLKAKRALFSTTRSLSLASFRLPVSVPRKPKLPTIQLEKISGNFTKAIDDKDEEYLKQYPVKGELDLLNLESLINMEDVSREKRTKSADVSSTKSKSFLDPNRKKST